MRTLEEDTDEEYLDDPIILIDFEQERFRKNSLDLTTGKTEELKVIEEIKEADETGAGIDLTDSDVEIVATDNDVSPKKAKDTLPVTFFFNSRNVQQLNECRPLSIKLVDCHKHPWYYKKRCKSKDLEKEDIDTNKYTDSSQFIIDTTEEIMAVKVKPKIRPVDVTAYITHNKKYDCNIQKTNTMVVKTGEMTKEHKDKSQERLQFDFKKNQGLIGLKVVRFKNRKTNSSEKDLKNVVKAENNLKKQYVCSSIKINSEREETDNACQNNKTASLNSKVSTNAFSEVQKSSKMHSERVWSKGKTANLSTDIYAKPLSQMQISSNNEKCNNTSYLTNSVNANTHENNYNLNAAKQKEENIKKFKTLSKDKLLSLNDEVLLANIARLGVLMNEKSMRLGMGLGLINEMGTLTKENCDDSEKYKTDRGIQKKNEVREVDSLLKASLANYKKSAKNSVKGKTNKPIPVKSDVCRADTFNGIKPTVDCKHDGALDNTSSSLPKKKRISRQNELPNISNEITLNRNKQPIGNKKKARKDISNDKNMDQLVSTVIHKAPSALQIPISQDSISHNVIPKKIIDNGTSKIVNVNNLEKAKKLLQQSQQLSKFLCQTYDSKVKFPTMFCNDHKIGQSSQLNPRLMSSLPSPYQQPRRFPHNLISNNYLLNSVNSNHQIYSNSSRINNTTSVPQPNVSRINNLAYVPEDRASKFNRPAMYIPQTGHSAASMPAPNISMRTNFAADACQTDILKMTDMVANLTQAKMSKKDDPFAYKPQENISKTSKVASNVVQCTISSKKCPAPSRPLINTPTTHSLPNIPPSHSLPNIRPSHAPKSNSRPQNIVSDMDNFATGDKLKNDNPATLRQIPTDTNPRMNNLVADICQRNSLLNDSAAEMFQNRASKSVVNMPKTVTPMDPNIPQSAIPILNTQSSSSSNNNTVHIDEHHHKICENQKIERTMDNCKHALQYLEVKPGQYAPTSQTVGPAGSGSARYMNRYINNLIYCTPIYDTPPQNVKANVGEKPFDNKHLSNPCCQNLQNVPSFQQQVPIPVISEGSTILGHNDQGAVKTINIVNTITKPYKEKSVCSILDEDTTPVNTKSEMLEELSKVSDIDFLEKQDLKRPYTDVNKCSELIKMLKSKKVKTDNSPETIEISVKKPQQTQNSTAVSATKNTSIPATNASVPASHNTISSIPATKNTTMPTAKDILIPTTKKTLNPVSKTTAIPSSHNSPEATENTTIHAKKNNMISKGYSPPILPIPTFEKTLELLAQATRETMSDKTMLNNTTPHRKRLKLRAGIGLDKNTKKISLDEYKKRLSNNDDKDLNRSVKIKIESGSPKVSKYLKVLEDQRNSDLDLGYDSDTTVRL